MGKPYNLIRNKYKTSVKKLTKKQRTESIKNYYNKKPAGPFRTENMFEKIDSTTAKTSTTNK